MKSSSNRILDELLVLQSQQGDEESFEKLFRRWNVPLRRHALRLTQNQTVADDIVQEAWVDIVRNIKKLKHPAAFQAWAYRIITNKSADWIRRKKLCKEVSDETVLPQQTHRNSEENSTNDVHQQLREVIRMLPDGVQQILTLYYLQDMSTREIAVALKIPQGTVKSRLYHARDQLRDLMKRKTR